MKYIPCPKNDGKQTYWDDSKKECVLKKPDTCDHHTFDVTVPGNTTTVRGGG